MRIFTILSLSILISTCRTASELSDEKYAHYSPDRSVGGPIGRLELLRQAIPTNFTNLRICVQTGVQGLSDNELLLEVKLAYALWLKATKTFAASDWGRFSFEGLAKCDPDSTEFAAYIVVHQVDAEMNRTGAFGPFSVTQVQCIQQEATISCKSLRPTTLGIGGPGAVMIWKRQSGQWVKIEGKDPSSSRFSPFVSWRSLEAELKLQDSQTLAEENRTALLQQYRTLVELDAPSFEQLVDFGDKLKTLKLVQTPDTMMKDAMDEFVSQNLAEMIKNMKPNGAFFHTLLHEVGHQMGLDHADHPQGDSVSGQSATTTKDAQGKWNTKEATMAYGDSFLYLTDDDEAGVAAYAESMKALVTSHK